MMVLIKFNFGRKCFLKILETFPVLFSPYTQALSNDCLLINLVLSWDLHVDCYLPSKGKGIL